MSSLDSVNNTLPYEKIPKDSSNGIHNPSQLLYSKNKRLALRKQNSQLIKICAEIKTKNNELKRFGRQWNDNVHIISFCFVKSYERRDESKPSNNEFNRY